MTKTNQHLTHAGSILTADNKAKQSKCYGGMIVCDVAIMGVLQDQHLTISYPWLVIVVVLIAAVIVWMIKKLSE